MTRTLCPFLEVPSHRRYAGGMRALLVVTALLFSVGCAPRAGVVRPEHPLLTSEAGRAALLAPRDERVVWDAAVPDDDEATRGARSRIAKTAAESVGKGPLVVEGVRFRMDCSGVARGIYAKAGFPLGFVEVAGATNDTRVLFELVRKKGSLRRTNPLPGDLVFFDDTWDQNGNGRRDDPLSHVGIVELVEADGTVVLVHRQGRKIVRARMNLGEPHARHDKSGRAINHYLRTAQGGHPAKTTAELFVAFGSLPLAQPSLLASW
jgi:peptidoglycan DL-endopeptidase CwlO